MKKPGFIITETIFSLILAASVAAVGVLAYDLNTDRFHLDRFNPFVQEEQKAVEESGKKSGEIKGENENIENSGTKENNKENKENSAASETSDKSAWEESGEGSAVKEDSGNKADESSGEESKTEESSDGGETLKLVSEPEDLSGQPEDLMESLGRYGYDLVSLMNGNKLIMVDTTSTGSRTRAIVYCYEKSDSGYWWSIAGEGKPVTDEAYIGENGSDFDPSADSKITPGGIYTVGKGFYIDEKPDTTYDMFRITDKTYWVTDPGSKSYNKLVEGTENKDWSKAEHMITSEKSYKYGLVTNYNVFDTDETRASAIFVCCGNSPTEGSIALPDDVMKTILEWLDDNSIVMIFVTV